MGLSGAAKICFIASLISLAATTLLYIKCDTRDIAGVNKPYVNRSVKYCQKTCATYKGTGYANKKKFDEGDYDNGDDVSCNQNNNDDIDNDEEEKDRWRE